MSPVINRIKINLELVKFLNILDTWVYPGVIRKTGLELGEMPLSMSIIIIKNMSSVQFANFPAKLITCSEWRKWLRDKMHISIINLHENIAKGYHSACATWIFLNRLHSIKTCSKAQHKKQKLYTGTPHVFVEEQKKPRPTCYSAPGMQFTVLWMTSLRSMM